MGAGECDITAITSSTPGAERSHGRRPKPLGIERRSGLVGLIICRVKSGARPVETSLMVTCPTCGLVLQTLDLPCPACSTNTTTDFDAATLHEYSEAFRTRHWFRPDPGHFADELSAWLATQSGVVGVTPTLHFDAHGTVKGATLTCLASSRPVPYSHRIFYLPLLDGALGWKRLELAAVLTEWSDSHPDYERVAHMTRTRMGQATECWLVARGPAVQFSSPSEPQRTLGLAVWGRRISVLSIFCALVGLLMVVLTVTGTAHLLGGLVLATAAFATPVIAGRLWQREPAHP